MDQVGNLLARPRLYYNIDGLGELAASAVCLGYAVVLWLLLRSPANSVWHRISIFVFLGVVFLIQYGIKAVKARITYPRTGFVEYRKRWYTAAIPAALGAAAAAGLAVGLRRHWDFSMLASLAGLAFAASYGYGFARAAPWKWVIAGTMAVVPFVIALLPADVVGALGGDSTLAHPEHPGLDAIILLSLTVYGTMLLISGGVTLWLYLRHTQAPAQEVQ